LRRGPFRSGSGVTVSCPRAGPEWPPSLARVFPVAPAPHASPKNIFFRKQTRRSHSKHSETAPRVRARLLPELSQFPRRSSPSIQLGGGATAGIRCGRVTRPRGFLPIVQNGFNHLPASRRILDTEKRCDAEPWKKSKRAIRESLESPVSC
jgi:hypothetical protein